MSYKHPILLVVFSLTISSCYAKTEQTDSNYFMGGDWSSRAELSYMGFSNSELDADSSLAKDIDDSLLVCLDTNANTVGEIGCYYDNTEIVLKKIAIVYKQLYAKLNKTDKQNLKITEQLWRKYYDAESNFIYTTFYTWANYQKYGHGTGSSIDQAKWRFQLARQHLIDLRVFSNNI